MIEIIAATGYSTPLKRAQKQSCRRLVPAVEFQIFLDLCSLRHDTCYRAEKRVLFIFCSRVVNRGFPIDTFNRSTHARIAFGAPDGGVAARLADLTGSVAYASDEAEGPEAYGSPFARIPSHPSKSILGIEQTSERPVSQIHADEVEH